MSYDDSGMQHPGWPVERVLEWVREGCLLFDRDLRCVFANREASELLGTPIDRLTGWVLHDGAPNVVASELRHAALRARDALEATRASIHDEPADRWLTARLYPSRDGLLALLKDITADQRQATEAEAKAEYLQRLVDQLPAFLWVIDRDLIVRRLEGARLMLETLDRDRLIGMPMEDVTRSGTNDEDLELSMEMHRRVLRGEAGQYRATWQGIILESRIQPLRDRQGDIVGIVGVGIDVTMQTRIQEQLRASEERFRAVVEQSQDLIAIVGDDLRATYASPSHFRVLGYTSEEWTALDPWSILHRDDVDTARALFASMADGITVRGAKPMRLRTKNGEWRSVHIRLTDLRRNPAVRGIVVNATDVTEQLALEAQLRQSQRLEALGQLAGGVAHDFNNILAAIVGYAQLLHDDVPASDPRRDDVSRIIESAERATNITRQLLAFSRQQVLASERLDLDALVHQASGMLRALLPATIQLHLSPARRDTPIEVQADRGRLEQVVMNLAVNARDAMPSGGELRLEVSAGTTADGEETAVLRVSDTGVGMSREVQQHVFEPFFTTKEPGHGTGLGLATVHGIVRHYGGTISITSAPNEGTTVTVVLPRAAPGTAPERTATSPERVTHGGRVLVVEDEASVREVTTRFLIKAGYDVVAARDAREAIEHARTTPPFDVVVTDSAMPGMRGQELAQELTRLQPGLPVILMSGFADRPLPTDSPSVAAFIQKPFTRETLLAEVRRQLALRRKL